MNGVESPVSVVREAGKSETCGAETSAWIPKRVEETVLIDTKKTSRRNFLLAVGAGGAATAAAIAARKPVTAKPAARTESARQDKGYEETAHVRNYYRTTRV